MAKAWILVGMMGVGKSAVGRSLAKIAGREFQDTDLILQSLLGKSIAQIFETYGEPAFRDHEHGVLKRLVPEPIVLSTGGGIVLRPDNWHELRRLGTTVYLEAKPETLIARLSASKKKRPLLFGDAWEERLRAMLAARAPLYQLADIAVSVDGKEVDAVASELLQLLREAS